jgi:hypothetical protein
VSSDQRQSTRSRKAIESLGQYQCVHYRSSAGDQTRRLRIVLLSNFWKVRALVTRVASCGCGQLRVACDGEPVRISICHCLECQKRTGSVFSAQARFPRACVTAEGRATRWTRAGDSGQRAVFSFCPVCGSTVCWTAAGAQGFVTVAVGAFADPGFPPPRVSAYEERQHPWALAPASLPMEHEF